MDRDRASADAVAAIARPHLEQGEDAVPVNVARTIEYFLQRKLWFRLSRNPKVLSCRDAASRRHRLGHVGIALQDELRSYLMSALDSDGQSVFVVFHCRGTARFNFATATALPELQGLQLRKASESEVDGSSVGYGLVNPFTAQHVLGHSGATILQFFDPSVIDGSGETGTMMTNAGDHTWAIEFNPRELLGSSEAPGKLAPIAAPEESERVVKPVGILTGNAPESGALLWKKINARVRELLGEDFRGDVSYPRTIVHSVPAMGWTMELAEREEAIYSMVSSEIQSMAIQGADLVAIACNTTQYFVNRLNQSVQPRPFKLVSMVDAVDRFLASCGDERVFVAGIGYVTNEPRWSAFAETLARDNVVLPDDRQSMMIEQLAYRVKQGAPENEIYQKFRTLIRSAGTSKILLLLTELSMIMDLFPRTNLGSIKIVDSLSLYADLISAEAVT